MVLLLGALTEILNHWKNVVPVSELKVVILLDDLCIDVCYNVFTTKTQKEIEFIEYNFFVIVYVWKILDSALVSSLFTE
jgi:hypothetical protein